MLDYFSHPSLKHFDSEFADQSAKLTISEKGENKNIFCLHSIYKNIKSAFVLCIQLSAKLYFDFFFKEAHYKSR